MQVIAPGNLQFRTAVPDIHIDLVVLTTLLNSHRLSHLALWSLLSGKAEANVDGAVQEMMHHRTCMIRYYL